MKHEIPDWYIPDEEQVLANEHETEQIEEEGELEEPLCPHCGEPYEEVGSTGKYGHSPMIRFDGGATSPGIWCSERETRRKTRQYKQTILDGDMERLR